ncbi:MAG: hypothetical protein ABI808_08755 [Pseudonocardiales bacterium]
MARSNRADLTLRIVLGTIGALGIGYGTYRLLGNPSAVHPLKLAPWLIGAIVLHDFVLTPIVLGVGLLLTRFVAPRARRYVQGGLVTSALVTAIALPLIYRRGKGLPGKALLERNYAANLVLILVLIAAGTAAAYGIRVARDSRGQRGSDAKVRPSVAQTSGTP